MNRHPRTSGSNGADSKINEHLVTQDLALRQQEDRRAALLLLIQRRAQSPNRGRSRAADLLMPARQSVQSAYRAPRPGHTHPASGLPGELFAVCAASSAASRETGNDRSHLSRNEIDPGSANLHMPFLPRVVRVSVERAPQVHCPGERGGAGRDRDPVARHTDLETASSQPNSTSAGTVTRRR